MKQLGFICSQCPNYDRICKVLLEHGVEELLEKCQMSPGTPLKPMLAHPTKGVSEVLQRFDGIKFTCEWKYDGERAQVRQSDYTLTIPDMFILKKYRKKMFARKKNGSIF